MQILIVDDEPSICEVLSLLLQEYSHEVECAANGSQALELFPHHRWDLVITDRIMPGLSGDDLARSIRRMDADVPIMLVSGQKDKADSFPFDAVLPKPFTRETLLKALKQATEPRRLRECPADLCN